MYRNYFWRFELFFGINRQKQKQNQKDRTHNITAKYGIIFGGLIGF